MAFKQSPPPPPPVIQNRAPLFMNKLKHYSCSLNQLFIYYLVIHVFIYVVPAL